MKVVGITIGAGRLAVSVVQRQLGKAELVDAFVRSYASDAELAGVLRGLAASWPGAKIVSAIPGRFFGQRLLTLPFSDRKRIEKALPFELEDSVPFGLDEVVLDHLVLSGGKGEAGAQVLCMMLPKSVLRGHLDLLAAAGIDPQAVVPSYAGLFAVARMLPADAGPLLLSGTDACLIANGTVSALRSFSPDAATGGLRHVLQALETDGKARVEKAALLADDAAVRGALADAGISAVTVLPELGGKKAPDPVSLGIALLEDVNFRKGEFAWRMADEGARRRKRTIIAAGAVAAALLVVNLSVKYSIVRSGYGKLDAEIKEIYRQTFPEGKPAADPVRQMRDRLAEAKKRHGALGSGASALDVMKTVTDGIPKEVRVGFTDFLLEADKLKLQGEASSFESVDKIKAELQRSPLFADVVVQDTRMGVDNKVKFRFEIKLKQAM